MIIFVSTFSLASLNWKKKWYTFFLKKDQHLLRRISETKFLCNVSSFMTYSNVFRLEIEI